MKKLIIDSQITQEDILLMLASAWRNYANNYMVRKANRPIKFKERLPDKDGKKRYSLYNIHHTEKGTIVIKKETIRK